MQSQADSFDSLLVSVRCTQTLAYSLFDILDKSGFTFEEIKTLSVHLSDRASIHSFYNPPLER